MLQEFSHCPQCLSLRQVQLLPLQQQQLTHHCCPQLSASFVVSCQFPPLYRFHSRRLIYISNHFARHSERSTNVEILLHNTIMILKDKIKKNVPLSVRMPSLWYRFPWQIRQGSFCRPRSRLHPVTSEPLWRYTAP